MTRRLLVPLGDTLMFSGAFLVALYWRFGQDPGQTLAKRWLVSDLVCVAVLQLCLYYADLYHDLSIQRPFETAVRFVQSSFAALLVLLLVFYVVPGFMVGRGVLALFLIVAFVALVFSRALYAWIGGDESLAAKVLILGTGSTAQKIAREVVRRRPWGLRIAGFLAEDPAEVGRTIISPSVMGTVDELLDLVRHVHAQSVVVALDDRRGSLPTDALLRCRMDGVRVEEGASVLERLTGRIHTKYLRPSQLVFSAGFRDSRIVRRFKLGSDFVGAVVLSVPLLPLMLLVAAAVKLTSRGPAIFRQERVGWKGRTFDVLKFRTMREDAEAGSGPVWASGESDPRITPLGRFLRKSRLDELPQILNVLRGEMSFVGPRPERPQFVDALRQVIPFYDARHTVRPGITGWAQIRCGYGSSIEDSELKLQYDLYYIKHLSLALDMSILIDTLKVMVVGRGAR